jgi:hypothetical protein
VKRILVLSAVIAVALALSSGASASGLTCAHGTCQKADLAGPPANGQGTLPFTGLDLVGAAAVGGILLVGGFTLQRASRRGR